MEPYQTQELMIGNHHHLKHTFVLTHSMSRPEAIGRGEKRKVVKTASFMSETPSLGNPTVKSNFLESHPTYTNDSLEI